MYYSKTAAYWFEFYFNYKFTEIDKDKSKKNWKVCNDIVNGLDCLEQDFIRDFYLSKESKSKVIKKHSKIMKNKEESLWKVVTDIEKDFAKYKGI